MILAVLITGVAMVFWAIATPKGTNPTSALRAAALVLLSGLILLGLLLLRAAL